MTIKTDNVEDAILKLRARWSNRDVVLSMLDVESMGEYDREKFTSRLMVHLQTLYPNHRVVVNRYGARMVKVTKALRIPRKLLS